MSIGGEMSNELLIDDPTERREILDFLQECGWSKDLSLAEILQSDLPRRAEASLVLPKIAVDPRTRL
jgi:hypothetical protein